AGRREWVAGSGSGSGLACRGRRGYRDRLCPSPMCAVIDELLPVTPSSAGLAPAAAPAAPADSLGSPPPPGRRPTRPAAQPAPTPAALARHRPVARRLPAPAARPARRPASGPRTPARPSVGAMASAGTTGPVLITDRTALELLVPVTTST